MGSIRGEWKAWLTVRVLVLRPRAAKSSVIARTASAGPEMTVAWGPLTAAMGTAGGRGARVSWSVGGIGVAGGPRAAAMDGGGGGAARFWCWVAVMGAMAPPGGRACMRRPRAVI